MNRPANISPEHAAAFQERSVVEAYRHRPPYPPETFDILAGLIADWPRRVLDLGCGTGFIARNLLDSVDAVDAVDALDVSAEMVAEGKRLPNGAHLALNWIVGRAEDAPLRPPYELVVAGDSLHWMDWEVVLPRLADVLTARGQLAIATVHTLPAPWDAAALPIMQRYSTYGDRYRSLDLIAELSQRDLFEPRGQRRTAPMAFAQSIDDYVQSFHGRAGFAKGRMPAADVAAFDQAIRNVVAQHAHIQGQVALQVVAEVSWGRPIKA
jgi:SAM-dependent methyltransferase